MPSIARLVAADEDTVRDVIHTFNRIGMEVLDPWWAGDRPAGSVPFEETFIVETATTCREKLGPVHPLEPGARGHAMIDRELYLPRS